MKNQAREFAIAVLETLSSSDLVDLEEQRDNYGNNDYIVNEFYNSLYQSDMNSNGSYYDWLVATINTINEYGVCGIDIR